LIGSEYGSGNPNCEQLGVSLYGVGIFSSQVWLN
jgi:hypothetical protein